MIKQITSMVNPQVKLWASLLTKKGREQQRKFVVEGIHLVKEALQCQAVVSQLIYSVERGWPEELGELSALTNRIEVFAASDAVIAKCTDAVTPQPVFAVLDQFEYSIESVLARQQPLVIAVDGIQDPGNLGTIIRSADAVAADAVILGRGTVDLYNPKTVRSSMGSLFHVPIVTAELKELLPSAAALGHQVVGTSLQAEDHCYEMDLQKGTWFVFGNEGQGLSPEIAKLVTVQTKIPMPGQAESLNVAMAATVLLYEALRQRRYCRI